jgi:hypothetical protein
MGRALKGVLVSGSALALVLLGLAMIDHRVRDRLVSVVRTGNVSSTVGSVTNVVGNAADVALMVARDQRLDNSLMVLFVVAASVLVFAVLRL